MTQIETDETQPTRRARLRKWSGEKAGITKGWLVLSIVLGWVFLFCAIYAAVRTAQLDNEVAAERLIAAVEQQVRTCEATNAVRAETRVVAFADVEEDRRIWNALATFLVSESLLDSVEESLAAREERINNTYVQRNCEEIKLEVISS